jgi:Flp pilus assembly protein TadD
LHFSHPIFSDRPQLLSRAPRKYLLAVCRALLLLTCLSQFAARAAAQKTPVAELTRISALIQQGKVDDAESALLKYLSRTPHSAKANNLLGSLYLREGNFPGAEKFLQLAIADAPNTLDPHLNLGDAYLAQAKLDPALAEYQTAAKISPSDPRANIALAKLYLARGDFAESIAAAGNIPETQRTAELLPTLAADYLGLRDQAKANLEIQAMLAVAQNEPDLVPELAEFFLAHEDFQSAQELLTLAQSKQPNTDRFLIDLARTQAALGQLDDAQKNLETVLARSPESVDAFVAAGQVATKQQDYASAEQAFLLAQKLSPSRPDILYGLVRAQLYANKPELALQNAQKLHALVPDDLRSTYLLALALSGLRKWDEAKPYALKVLAEHPNDREMNLVLVEVAMTSERNLQLAKKYANVVIAQNPSDSGGLYYLGMIHKMDGDIPGAIQYLKKSVAANHKNGEAQGALGALCVQTGDMPCARAALEDAVKIAPNESQHHYQLALFYSRSGEPDKAKTELDLYNQMKAKEAKDAKSAPEPPAHPIPPAG